MNDEEIAREILRRMGGNKFLAMVPVKHLVCRERGLSIVLRKSFKRVNTITIDLNGRDLYDVKYYTGMNWKTLEKKMINKSSDIYSDTLQSDFTEKTGLDTHL